VEAQQNAGNHWCELCIAVMCVDTFFDVHGEFVLINAHLFDILPALSSKKVGDFFSAWRIVTLYMMFTLMVVSHCGTNRI